MFGFDQWIESQRVQVEKLRKRVEAGLPINDYFGVDSFFLSRTDILFNAIFEKLKTEGKLSKKDIELFEKIKDMVAVSQAKIVGRWSNYVYFGKELPKGTPKPPELDRLKAEFESIKQSAREKGLGSIRPRVPLWASTMVKEPDVKRGVDPLLYFVNLIGPNTVDTMPDGLIEAIEERFSGMTDNEKEAAIAKLDNAIDDDSIIVKYDPRGQDQQYAPAKLTPAKILAIANHLLGKWRFLSRVRQRGCEILVRLSSNPLQRHWNGLRPIRLGLRRVVMIAEQNLKLSLIQAVFIFLKPNPTMPL